MTSVTLSRYEPPGRRHFIDGHEVSVRRLKGSLELGRGSQTHFYDCLIDTGAYLTVVPHELWYPLFQNEIHWLAKKADPLLPAWLRGVSSIDGKAM